LNSLPRRHEIVSLTFIGEGKDKDLKLEDDKGGFSREKELGLLIPVICTNITVLRFYNVIYSKFYKQNPRKIIRSQTLNSSKISI